MLALTNRGLPRLPAVDLPLRRAAVSPVNAGRFPRNGAPPPGSMRASRRWSHDRFRNAMPGRGKQVSEDRKGFAAQR